MPLKSTLTKSVVTNDLTTKEAAHIDEGIPGTRGAIPNLTEPQTCSNKVECFTLKHSAQRYYSQFPDALSQLCISSLKENRPQDSAFRLLSQNQAIGAAFLFSVSAILAIYMPVAAFILLNVFTTAYFLCAIAFRVWLLALSKDSPVGVFKPIGIQDVDLPVITILLPLYKDAEALPTLISSIDLLDYPDDKKDIKLLLEKDDPETLQEAIRLGLDRRFQLIVTPDLGPKTKPKACNYGLHLASGDLIVIYDAEDQPEPDQLRKAASAFHLADDRLACVQARLNYYNHDDNWLTRLFTLEYSLWFDWLLPSLQRMKAPIPLGGTSNFFRTKILIRLGGWDPYNVTEDADLGLRISKHGYLVELLDSTTFEEANCRARNWIRQRSRWLKGYLQTWLVHMRQPEKIIQTTGWSGFLAVQLFVAGNIFSALINPIMWCLSLFWIVASPPYVEMLFPASLVYFNFAALIIGNSFFVAIMVLAPIKRGRTELCVYGLTTPIYWLLTSVAAYKAMWQAVLRPHYWEKTDHFISETARERRNRAITENS
ncbi:glycosyltransferase family 2 protein [Hyphococcus flavus]|uniref:Glycosyltransferase family 2 protein n=1 Tax=Hyphococcus flavus TaxID=1866326 RepID=A0AAE9ZC04_9PROT|nr:glycosyltransferase family 2 protein [Hyphococcus flavus]WDI30022.1 glycosyltransferase family 2 protein [Hyphococcus flavus]